MYKALSKHYNHLFHFNEELEGFLSQFTAVDKDAIDLGCGTGRLTHLIHHLGMHVIGIDLDQDMINVAQNNYPFIDFEVANLLDSLKNKQFDLITCFGNTIVHLSLVELKYLFRLISNALTEKGFFIFQMLNYDSILKTKPDSLRELRHDSTTLVRKYHYESNHIRFETELHTADGTFEGFTTIYPYQTAELKQMINEANLDVSIYGDLVKDEIGDDKQYLYFVICQKNN